MKESNDNYYQRLSDDKIKGNISRFILLKNQYNKTRNIDFKRKLTLLSKQCSIKQISDNLYAIHDNIANRQFVVNKVQYKNGLFSDLLTGILL